MTKRYHCPKHSERTPSAVVYPTGYYCFGCGARGPVTELGLDPSERIEVTYVEDLEATLNYIGTLPKKTIRGFELPFNSGGYYIVYPDRTYYKYRSNNPEASSKYKGPSGHKKTPYVAKTGGETLVLVEGEFNAMSAALVLPEHTVISPGGAGDFYSKGSERYLQEYAKYSKVFIVVDDDTAGLLAGIECKSRLAALGASQVEIKLVKKDFNDLYVEKGKEGLATYCRELGLYGGVQGD